MRTQPEPPQWIFYVLMVAMVAVPLLLLMAWTHRRFEGVFADRVIRFAAAHMTEEDKQKYYRLLADEVPGLYSAIPEPAVGRVLKPHIRKRFRGAEVVSNNAGMRDRRPYVAKPEDVFRIVCVGDSVVMGVAGKEEDRWGNQVEEILNGLLPEVDGKRVEVYSLGLGSWTALNEATYVTSRLSEYDPDLLLALLIPNDISDTEGVSGIGQPTDAFSPQFRNRGSGVLSYRSPYRFGILRNNLLSSGIGPESQSRWRQALKAWRRLEDLLAKRGGRMILGAWDHPLFRELVRLYARGAGLRSPLLFTSHLGHPLPHDGHPDREGHRILASHYLHRIAQGGWLPIRRVDLPPLEKGLTLGIARDPKPARIRELQADLVRDELDEAIAFDDLSEKQVVAFLGGIYPGDNKERLKSHPFGSLRSAFLLRRRPGAAEVVLEIDVPDFVELYPFRLEMLLDGQVATTLVLGDQGLAGRHVLVGELPGDADGVGAVEVSLQTGSYWTTISDPTMKSYRLISVSQR